MRYFIFSLLLASLPAVNSLAQPVTKANTPPDMARQADLNLFTQKNTGYRFQTVDFKDDQGIPRHRVHILIPERKPPTTGFPALFALDGNALPELLNPQHLRQLSVESPLVFVFIAPANNLRLDGDARAYDYTPPDTHGKPLIDALKPSRKNGGAAEYLKLITQQIRPEVAKLAPLNTQRQTLWGHSYGGLFVLYALFHQGGFSQYIAADPSLWWQSGLFMQQMDTILAQSPQFHHTQLWIEKSGKERKKVAQNTAQQKLIQAREKATASISPELHRQFAQQLSALSGLKVHYQDYPNDTHGSLFSDSFLRAIDIATTTPINIIKGQP